MKVVVRADIVQKLHKVLSDRSVTDLCLLFGRLEVAGFVPEVSPGDCRSLSSSFQRLEDGEVCVGYETLTGGGFIHSYDVVLGCEKGGEVMACERYEVCTDPVVELCMVAGTGRVSVRFLVCPTDLQVLMGVVKTVLRGMLPDLEEVGGVPDGFNRLFGKIQLAPWIVPKGVHRLRHGDLECLVGEYGMADAPRGEPCTLYLSTSAYLVVHGDGACLEVPGEVPGDVQETVVWGDWFEGEFVGYDVSVYRGNDVCKYSLMRRVKILRDLEAAFRGFRVAAWVFGVGPMALLREGGALLAPVKANYSNDRTYVYHPIDQVSVRFHLRRLDKRSYDLYEIGMGVGEGLVVFAGTETFPFHGQIPVSLEYREIVGWPYGELFEFRWMHDGLVPYRRSRSRCSSSVEEAGEIWNFMNESF